MFIRTLQWVVASLNVGTVMVGLIRCLLAVLRVHITIIEN